jgi:acid phosphatase type 7
MMIRTMKKWCVLQFVAVAMMWSMAAQAAVAPALTRAPYIQNLKPQSVDILWRTDAPAETWVEVRERGEGGVRVVYHSNVPTASHRIRVPGLKPDTMHEYRVGFAAGKFFKDAFIPFQTFPDGPAPDFDFVAYGDHRNYPNDHRAVVQAIIRMSEKRGWPRFMLDSGDFTGHGEHARDFWDEQFFGPAQPLIERVCLFPVIGNHEAPGAHPRIPFRYFENFSVPTETSGTPYYYSFTYGNAHFCMIDWWATDFTTGSKQWEWVRRDLGNSDKPWKFVAMHHSPYAHRARPNQAFGDSEVRRHLVPLFEKHGVTALFAGHNHFYQRSDVNGIHYIVTGGAGAPLYEPGSEPDYVRVSKMAHHYTWISIRGDEMELTAYDKNNDVIDRFKTNPRAPERKPEPEINFQRRLPTEAMKPGETFIVESRDAAGKLSKAPVYVELGGLADSTVKSRAPGLTGQGSRYSDNGEADAAVRITPPIKAAGHYLISITVPSAASVNAPNSVFEVAVPGREVIRGRVALTAANAGDKWFDIGLLELAPGATLTLIEADDEPERFSVDAVKFTRYE